MTDEQQKGPNSTPVNDISDSKVEVEESFLKELDEAEKVSTTAAGSSSVPPEAPKGEKSKSRFSAAMDSMNSKPKRKREIDPILGVSLVILLFASLVVLGNTVYAEFVDKDSGATIDYGDTVDVKYTGAFYTWYDSNDHYNGAIVFDTNVEDVDKYMKDHSEAHSWGYTQKTSYSTLSFIVGGTTVLKKFGSSTVGHKVGDKIPVFVGRDEGYELPDTVKGAIESTPITKTLTMTTSEFSSLYGIPAPTSFCELDINYEDHKDICPFGCSFKAALVDGKVMVTNFFECNPPGGDHFYYMFGNNNAKIEFNNTNDGIYIDYLETIPETGKMTKLAVYHDNAWTVGYAYYEKNDSDQNIRMYKTGEALGQELYFTIEIVSIKKA